MASKEMLLGIGAAAEIAETMRRLGHTPAQIIVFLRKLSQQEPDASPTPPARNSCVGCQHIDKHRQDCHDLRMCPDAAGYHPTPPASEPEPARDTAARLGLHIEPSQERIDAVSPSQFEPEPETARVCGECWHYAVDATCALRGGDETDSNDYCKHWTPRKEASDGE